MEWKKSTTTATYGNGTGGVWTTPGWGGGITLCGADTTITGTNTISTTATHTH